MTTSNEPAFPLYQGSDVQTAFGLTKREYFAALVLTGLIPSYDRYKNQQGSGIQMMVGDAVDIADELLKQLENTKPI